jgi:hypothetical protein
MKGQVLLHLGRVELRSSARWRKRLAESASLCRGNTPGNGSPASGPHAGWRSYEQPGGSVAERPCGVNRYALDPA